MLKIHKSAILFLSIIILNFSSCTQEKSIQIRVDSKQDVQIEEIISLDLVNLGISDKKNEIELLCKIDNKFQKVPFQIDKDRLFFMHSKNSIDYLIKNGKYVSDFNRISSTKEDGNLVISNNNRPVLNYRYGMTFPPKGVDSLFKKSGYIHPLLTLKGDTLTRIQPPDHYHHYGIWGPWTHTQINGQQVDFWNLGDRKGTVLFKEFKNNNDSGDVFASFNASQEHIDLITLEKPQVALNEDLEVTLWNLNRPDRYMFDYATTFSSPLKDGILFEAYRYGGGIGMRFTERWHKNNCTVLTSEGNERLTADGTTARWCIISGESADGKGANGILFMSHPSNHTHPEPMRIWPNDANEGRGDMFFEFCPIRHTEWKIEPGVEYGLNYRMVVFDGHLDPEEAEAYWQTFANPSKTRIIKK